VLYSYSYSNPAASSPQQALAARFRFHDIRPRWTIRVIVAGATVLYIYYRSYSCACIGSVLLARPRCWAESNERCLPMYSYSYCKAYSGRGGCLLRIALSDGPRRTGVVGMMVLYDGGIAQRPSIPFSNSYEQTNPAIQYSYETR
jgi:hypothetical protein